MKAVIDEQSGTDVVDHGVSPVDSDHRSDRVLVVGGDPASLDLLRRYLTEEGYEVLTASNGPEALDIVQNDPPLIIITDWMMPQVDGLEFCRAIRNHTETRFLYVIVLLTAHSGMDCATEAFKAGADDCLSQPFDERELVARVSAGQRMAHLVQANSRMEQEIARCRQVEEALRENQEFHCRLLDNAPNPVVVVDAGTSVRYMNPALEKLTGFSSAEIIGTKAPYPWWTEETLEKTSADFQDAVHNGATRLEELFHKKSGERFWVEITSAPVQDDGVLQYYVANWVDITERRRAQEALRESERRFSDIAANALEWIWEVDVNGRYAYASPGVESILGYRPEEVLEKHFYDLFHPEDREELKKAALEIIARKESFRGFMNRNVHKDGRTVWLLTSGVPVLDEEGNLRGYRGADVDITERQQCEVELREYHRNLEKVIHERSRELLEAQRKVLQNEKLASVGQLAAGVAHEINTPIQYVGDNLRALSDSFADLNALVAKYRELAELVRSGGHAPEAIGAIDAAEQDYDLQYILEDTPRAIEQSLEGVERVAHIVRAMKDFSHVDRGEVARVDINHALETTLTVARNEYKYVADIVTDWGELPAVKCHASELNQVFLNLVINAAHAIADTARRGTITISTRADGDQVEIAIGDTGTGIPEDIQAKVFDPFFTTKGVGRGTGQGLNIAHQIVVGKHRGSLTFETELGKGTTFVIRLPVEMEGKTTSEPGVAEHG